MNKNYETPSAIVLLMEKDVVLASGGTGENYISWDDYAGGNE